MFRTSLLLALLGAFLALAPLGDAPARGNPVCAGVKPGVDAGRVVPLESVISAINRKYPGELLNACLDASNPNRPIYRVAWLSNGRKMNIVVNAKNGQIISV